jgi:hypothetical protein
MDSRDGKKVLESLVKKGIVVQVIESKFSLNDFS